MMLDIQKIRKDFPIFKKMINEIDIFKGSKFYKRFTESFYKENKNKLKNKRYLYI